MHAVPFIPTISFKLAERDRFYVDADRFTRTPFFLFPRVIIQIRKLLVVPPCCSCVRSYKSTLFQRVCSIEIKNGDTINRMLRDSAQGSY